MTKVICVVGVGCVGKSTYCKNLVKGSKPRPVLLQAGRFFREAIGPTFFAELDNPAAPAQTESWVRNMVWHAIEFAHWHGRDVIIDAFPRTPDQFHWLMLSSPVSAHPLPVEIHTLFTSEGVLDQRLAARRVESSEEDLVLFEARVLKDAALMHGLTSAIEAAVGEHKYPELDVKVVNT